ncbi:hypothetical protein H0W91_02165 [Patescibacteria group bacterium]|nr:hypothetical protein [Patescibacteria group bacterium]
MIVTFLFTSIIYFFYFSKKPSPIPIVTREIPLDEKKPEVQLDALRFHGKIVVPDIQASSSIDIKSLPLNILNLFGKNLNDLKLSSLVFTNGQNGFLAEFSTSTIDTKSIIDNLATKSTTYSWNLTYGIYSLNAALANLENNEYKASIEATLYSDHVTFIHIIIIKK